MPRGNDTSRDPSRKPQIIDLNHYRKTGQIADVSDVSSKERTEAIRENTKKKHPTKKRTPSLNDLDWKLDWDIDPLLPRRKKSTNEEELGPDDAPPHGIPRPKIPRKDR